MSNSFNILSSVDRISSRASLDANDGSRPSFGSVGRSSRCVTEEDVEKIKEGKMLSTQSKRSEQLQNIFGSYDLSKH